MVYYQEETGIEDINLECLRMGDNKLLLCLVKTNKKPQKTIPLQVILNGNGVGFVPWGQKDQNSKGMAYPPLDKMH